MTVATAKEIKDRMKSIQDTMKITNAMYMISSSKLRKAKKALADTEPYFYTLQYTMSRILRHIPDVHLNYFQKEEDSDGIHTVAYIVVTADKGMAGAYNHNVLKMAEEKIRHDEHSRLYVMGEIGRHYFEHKGINIDRQFHFTVQNPTLSRARNIVETILADYQSDAVDEVYMIYTNMVNSMQTETQIQQLLPLKRSDFNVKIPADVPMEELAMRWLWNGLFRIIWLVSYMVHW